MRTGRRILCAILLMATLALPAASDVIFDNGGPDQGYIWFSDPSYALYRVAEDFVLAPGANVITDIHWWGSYISYLVPPEGDDFTITIYDTSPAGSVPGSVVYSDHVGAVSRVDPGLNGVGELPIYAYSLLVDPITLAADTTYWLEIVNDTNGSMWGWSTASYEGGSHGEYDGHWYREIAELAFNLTNDGQNDGQKGVVPEPASIALVGLGIAGLARRRFFKRG
ncbi:MAG: PEP-CTERM sorting domain-containing protein [FCB group bacterium]|nr:PEP-CTERM sorting domain-containing protein [FCB group bacterium]